MSKTDRYNGGEKVYLPPRTISTRIMDLAYIRDENLVHTDEAVVLACLLHTKGKGRNSDDFKEVQRIMKDKNLDREQD